MPETGGEESHVSIAMRVIYTATYPEEPPTLAVRALKGLSSAQAADLRSGLAHERAAVEAFDLIAQE